MSVSCQNSSLGLVLFVSQIERTCFNTPIPAMELISAKSARVRLGSASSTLTELSRLASHRSNETNPSCPAASTMRATSSRESSVFAAWA